MVLFSKIPFPTDFSENSVSLFEDVVYFARLQKGKHYVEILRIAQERDQFDYHGNP
jgi:hypothetical protein